MRRNPDMITDYRQDLRLFRSRTAQLGVLALALLWLVVPFQVDDTWLAVLNTVAVYAIGGISLNLLTGYTGQVSLGHAFFMAVGAFSAAYLGRHGWPMLAWLVFAGLLGGVIGSLIGPVALRLHGNYLAIVTIGLLFLGEHVLDGWHAVSGGSRGTSSRVPLAVGPLDFDHLGGLSRAQGRFWLLWALAALVALVAKNIARSRPGRAMQAVRDRDIAAEVVGISLVRTKLGAFAVSSGLAAVSGALFAATVVTNAVPSDFGGTKGLELSIKFVAVIIIGGMGTIHGSILGAFVVSGLPEVIQRISSSLPFLEGSSGGFISVGAFNNAVFGLLVIVFLLAEPLGLAGVWLRIKTYFKSWPFSY